MAYNRIVEYLSLIHICLQLPLAGLLDIPVIPPRIAIQKEPDKQPDVFLARPQRRNGQGDDGQAIVPVSYTHLAMGWRKLPSLLLSNLCGTAVIWSLCWYVLKLPLPMGILF